MIPEEHRSSHLRLLALITGRQRMRLKNIPPIGPVPSWSEEYRSLPERLNLKRLIREGECIPPYMGLAYHDFDMDRRIAWVVPINWVVRCYRELTFYLRFPNYGRSYDKPALGRREEYERSLAVKWRQQVRNQGYNDAVRDIRRLFNLNEMDKLEHLMYNPEYSEKAQNLLSDIHHNYVTLHFKDMIRPT